MVKKRIPKDEAGLKTEADNWYYDRLIRSDYFDMMGARRRNEIVYMVNCLVPKEEAGLRNEAEIWWFGTLMEEATEMEKLYGKCPSFSMEEIDYDDPCLDIYND